MINWNADGQKVDNTSELQRLTAVVYHTDSQPQSTARFRHAGQLASADTCCLSDDMLA